MRSALALLLLAGCATSAPIPSVRFANAPPVQVVNDRLDVPKPPKEIDFVRYLYNFDGQILRPITRTLELRRHERARGVNALDEVPSSTWFTNRIGVRAVSPEEILDPPGSIGSPEQHKPWTIVSSKVGGVTVGFIMKDARGEKFVLKFDPRGYPEAETAAQVIAGRLLWAFGYNVTDDYVVYLEKSDLQLSPKAVVKDLAGHSKPLDQAQLERMLVRVETAPGGTMRALASHYLDGKPLGGHPGEGVRDDDPNDRIPHQLRRDLRGAYVPFAWLDHNDIHGGQMLDMYVEDPAVPGRHYVKHYWVDFGVALGFAATKNREPRFSHEYLLDPTAMARSLLTLGLVERPWESRGPGPRLRGVGHLETRSFDPGGWKANTPAYRPIYAADRFDKFWATKILARFTRDHIRAAVDAARLSDPRAAAWLTDALIERQRKTLRYWFERVNPLDGLAVGGTRARPLLCFTDLAIAHALAGASATHYTLTFYGRDDQRLGSRTVVAGDSGVSCGALVTSAGDPESYTVVRIDTHRLHFQGTTYAHVAQRADGALHVIGVWRE